METEVGAGPHTALDLSSYRAELAELSLSEEQERELLETLWSIMGFFARAGFEVDVCGLIFEDLIEAAAPLQRDGSLTHSTNRESASEPNGAAHER